MNRKAIFKIRGMQRDLSASNFNPQYAYEIRNMRLTPIDTNNMLALTNERGSTRIKTLDGTVIGATTINDSLILFTKQGLNTDSIYKIEYKNGKYDSHTLFSGDLGFSYSNLIETLIDYENEAIQKVYWIDGKNECRVINIADEKLKNYTNSIKPNYFSFVKEIQGTEKVTVEKNFSFGIFASGVIQYALTYYNQYSAESNIFYTSPLFYISNKNRVGDPEENLANSFKITIENPISEFDYIRVYSIHRTSWNAIPTVKVVTDIKIKNNSGTVTKLSYVDTGNQGYIEDPTYLLYVGGEKIIANAITQKDNTLFLGNYKVEKRFIKEEIKKVFEGNNDIVFKRVKSPMKTGDPNSFYSYESTLKYNSRQIKKFKYLETYRFGIQFQHKSGKWSEAIWLNDVKNNIFPCCGTFSNKSESSTASTFSLSRQDIVGGTTIPGGTEEGTKIPDSTGENDFDSPVLNKDIPFYLPEAFLETSDNDIIQAITSLKDEYGYISVRPLVVIPKPEEREVIAQGIVNPTVFNVKDRLDNKPFAQASWFFRPSITNDSVKYTNNSYIGANVEYQHLRRVNDTTTPCGEIQCIDDVNNDTNLLLSGDSNKLIVENSNLKPGNEHHFGIDRNIVTLNSPDLEFGNLTQSSYSAKFRIVGILPFTHSRGDILLQTNNSAKNFSGQAEINKGFIHTSTSDSNNHTYGGKVFSNVVTWYDEPASYFKRFWLASATKQEAIINNNYNGQKGYVGFPICAFHGKSINEDYGEIRKKVISNIRYVSNSIFFSNEHIWNIENTDNIFKANVFDSEDNIKALQIDVNINNIDTTKYYYGNVDTIINNSNGFYIEVAALDATLAYNIDKFKDRIITFKSPVVNDLALCTVPNNYTSASLADLGKYSGDNPGGNENYDTGTDYTTTDVNRNRIFFNNYDLLNTKYIKVINNTAVKEFKLWKSSYPIEMKYKSTTHFVFGFKNIDNERVILPDLDNSYTNFAPNTYTFYEGTARGINSSSNYITKIRRKFEKSLSYSTLWLGELYIDKPENKFGGNSKQAYEDNEWLVSGEAISLQSIISNNKLELNWQEGDTYFQRYDCLKTIPYTAEDKNQIVEIASFMCESRVNIDARYDNMRGQESNVYVNRNNFNLINPVYNQDNNFFVYRGLNTDKINLDNFPNTITWTKTKTNGELIDTWTNITLASTLDLDGDKGELRKLDKINNMLIAFQDRGISNIMYNENTQISSIEGVPIEIGNSGKVTGKRYLSNSIGCQNKWSIKNTPSGLYFIDNINKKIYLYDGQFKCLSDQLGFKSWCNNNIKEDFKSGIFFYEDDENNMYSVYHNSFITHYDYETNDVLFTNKDESLAYQEYLGNFSSFYSYNMPFLVYFNGHSIAIQNERPFQFNNNIKLYELRTNNNKYNNNILNIHNLNFGVEVIVNQDPTFDKIFNTVEFRADVFSQFKKDDLETRNTSTNKFDTYIENKTFDTIDVHTEYQEASLPLKYEKILPSNLKKKFRIWRTNIPRAQKKNENGTIDNTRDRMRNPWLYLKLSMNDPNFKERLILHDIVVDYFI